MNRYNMKTGQHIKSLCLQQTSSQGTNTHILTQANTALQNQKQVKRIDTEVPISEFVIHIEVMVVFTLVTMLASTPQPPPSSTDLLLHYHYCIFHQVPTR